jgi:hypothetical protein
MTGITALPTPPSTSDPTNFNTRADAFMAALPTFVTEANAYGAYLAAAAQGGAAYIASIWASGTSGDPGAGAVGGNNATQNASTALRIDDLDALGNTVSGITDSMDDSTSTYKGFLRVQVVGDPNAWLLWRVNGAVVNSTGYRTVPVTLLAGTASSPFTAGQAVMITFTPAGDKGDGAIWSTFATPALTGSSITLQASIPANSNDLKFSFDAVTNTSGASSPTILLSADGSAFSTAIALTNANVVRASGTVNIRHHRNTIMVVESVLADAAFTSPAGQVVAGPQFIPFKITGGAIAVRLAWTGADTFAGGGTLTCQSR